MTETPSEVDYLSFALGAQPTPEGVHFLLWAPHASAVELYLLSPRQNKQSMAAGGHGYFHLFVDGLRAGALYQFSLDGQPPRPDPASRHQPQGVHGPSEVVEKDFPWTDSSWKAPPLSRWVIYEAHVGTYTPEGTFEALIPHLDEIKDLGVTALELMPIAQFPGKRNWGYDGVAPFAAQNTYGGPRGLKTLVDACHARGLAVVLDVVYNHLGPEGNYLREFGPYFTDRHHTPWGWAVNFDAHSNDEIRRYFFESALQWADEFHCDALRLDALHGIFDMSAYTFIEELADVVKDRAQTLHRPIYLIAETDLNDTRLLRSKSTGGYEIDCQWNDDFHHALHALLTDETNGYYQDFGQVFHLVKAFKEGYVYSGEYSPFRRRRHGQPSGHLPAEKFVVYAQNHDQVGNRLGGERLSVLVDVERQKLAAAAVLLSPFIPMLFMGEEYGETAPFHYFVDHSDPGLINDVRSGRLRDFEAFHWKGDPPPDPQGTDAFDSSRLHRALINTDPHKTLLAFHRFLLRLRASHPVLSVLDNGSLDTHYSNEDRWMALERVHQNNRLLFIFHFSGNDCSISVPTKGTSWKKIFDSADALWLGPGTLSPDHINGKTAQVTLRPWSLCVYEG